MLPTPPPVTDQTRPVSRRLKLPALVLFVLGGFVSLKVVTNVFPLDPDGLHSLLVWENIQEHGIGWLRDWRFTQDSWLFSLFPIHFLEFWVLGPQPIIPLITGWVIFVLSALTAGAIASKLGLRFSPYIIAMLLVFAGSYAHGVAFLGHPISHNITNLFGLASILVLLSWLGKPTWPKIAVLFVLHTAAGVSDPWLLPGYTLPIILTLAVLLFTPRVAREQRPRYIALIAAMGCALLATRTALFGLLDFLPEVEFRIAPLDEMQLNALFWLKNLGGQLNVVPTETSNALLPGTLSLCGIGILFLIGLWRARGDRLPSPLLAALIFACLSLGGISLAFVIHQNSGQYGSARFLMSAFYLLPIATIVLTERYWGRLASPIKILAVVLALLFPAASLVSIYPYLKQNVNLTHRHGKARRVIRFLDRHGLDFGYGPYWSAQGNAVTVLSRSRIRLRPVCFDPASGKMETEGGRFQTSRRWYQAGDAPPGQREFFVWLEADGEQCGNIPLCIDGLIRQFGPPVKRLKAGPALILVWDHPLVGWEQSRPVVVSALPHTILFNVDNPLPSWDGWSDPEPWGTWSYGPTASVFLQVPDFPQPHLTLIVSARVFLGDGLLAQQEVGVLLNGQTVATLKYESQHRVDRHVIRVKRELALANNGSIHIRFAIKDPRSPMELGLSQHDTRKLGLGLVSLQLVAAD